MAVQFTAEMINGAIATEKLTGVPASITLGQLVLESGYTSPSSLSTLAKDYNNYFGVKALGSWTGKTTPYMTNSKGQDGAVYRAYDTVTDGMLDHAKVLQAERYQQYFRKATSIEDYANGLQAGGYATDPNYASKLINVIKNNNLTQYDGKTGGLTTAYEDFYSGTATTEQGESILLSNGLGVVDNVLSTVIVFVVLFSILVIAVISFMKAFSISIPSVSTVTGLMKGGAKDE